MRLLAKNYKRIVAIKEKSAGNDTVGDSWLETKSFHINTPVSDIMSWAWDASGKLILTIDESSRISEDEDDLPF